MGKQPPEGRLFFLTGVIAVWRERTAQQQPKGAAFRLITSSRMQ
jgi:hypothetical protein